MADGFSFSCRGQRSRPHRRDGPWAWLVLFYSFLCAMMAGGLGFSYGVILPVLMISLNENRERTALVGSLGLGIALFLCVVASKLCERLNCRITNGLGIIAYVVGLILSSLCYSIYPLYFTYSLLVGFGGSCVYCACFISIRQYFKKHFSMAMGIASAGAGTGVLSFGPFMQYLTDGLGWRNAFRILACMFALLLFLTFIHDPNVETDTEEQVRISANQTGENETQRQGALLCGFLDLSVWKFPEFTVSVISIFLSNFGHYTPLIHLVKYSEELGISPSQGSMLFIFIGASTIVSRLIAGRLCDVSFIKPRYINQASAVISGVATILLTLATSLTHLIIFAVVYGIADGAYRVTLNILFMNTVDQSRRSSAFGQANMVTSLTNAAGPAIAGLMADKMGSYSSAFYMAGTVTLVGAAVFSVHICSLNACKDRRQDQLTVDAPLDNIAAYSGPACDDVEDTAHDTSL